MQQEDARRELFDKSVAEQINYRIDKTIFIEEEADLVFLYIFDHLIYFSSFMYWFYIQHM